MVVGGLVTACVDTMVATVDAGAVEASGAAVVGVAKPSWEMLDVGAVVEGEAEEEGLVDEGRLVEEGVPADPLGLAPDVEVVSGAMASVDVLPSSMTKELVVPGTVTAVDGTAVEGAETPVVAASTVVVAAVAVSVAGTAVEAGIMEVAIATVDGAKELEASVSDVGGAEDCTANTSVEPLPLSVKWVEGGAVGEAGVLDAPVVSVGSGATDVPPVV
jgi:hypothetical protein